MKRTFLLPVLLLVMIGLCSSQSTANSTKTLNKTDAVSQYKLGQNLERSGHYVAAFNEYKKSADSGNRDAEYRLFQMYLKNKIPMDARAFSSYAWSTAAHGNLEVEVWLGTGICSPTRFPDPEKELSCTDVIPFLTDAAHRGDVRAQDELGRIYEGRQQMFADAFAKEQKEQAQSYPRDCGIAMEWLRRAAVKGDRFAIGEIGVNYSNDGCLPTDYARAVGWLRMAIFSDREDSEYLARWYAVHKAALAFPIGYGDVEKMEKGLRDAKQELEQYKLTYKSPPTFHEQPH